MKDCDIRCYVIHYGHEGWKASISESKSPDSRTSYTVWEGKHYDNRAAAIRELIEEGLETL